MPPYDLLGVENVLYMTAVGLLVALGVILARGSRTLSFTPRKRSDAELDADVHEFGGEVSESTRPVPWLIWLVFVGYFVWAAAYAVFIGRNGL
jgi:4-hydroxybenzoate polyprenyltransferase